jgi:hypothetical protein
MSSEMKHRKANTFTFPLALPPGKRLETSGTGVTVPVAPYSWKRNPAPPAEVRQSRSGQERNREL